MGQIILNIKLSVKSFPVQYGKFSRFFRRTEMREIFMSSTVADPHHLHADQSGFTNFLDADPGLAK